SAELMARGASVVIGTETSVTDAYATRVFSRVYTELTQTDVPDVVAAVAEARRIVQRDLVTSPDERDTVLARLDEWSVLTVLAGAGSVPVVDTTARESRSAAPEQQRDRHAGLLQRDVGEFVGRRHEQRSLPETVLAPTGVGAVLHGIGGIGKTTLAAELIALITGREPDRLIAVATGEITVDTVLGCVANALRTRVSTAGDTAQTRHAVDYLARTDEPWQHRWQVLRTRLLPRYPLLLVLDNFEDNLTDDPHERCPRDTSLAKLLAIWVRDGSTSRVLITSRFPFGLPEQAQQRLVFQAIGPMSLAEMLKLAWSLPAIDRLPDAELERVWRLVGGHPRTLEYLDALLAGGHARFDDVTDTMTTAVQRRFGDDAVRVLATSTTLDAAIGVSLTLAADDVLLPALMTSIEHVPDARRLLLGVAVYREPVDTAAALFQIGDPDPTAAHTSHRRALTERIEQILTEAGVTTDTPLAWDDVPAHLHEQLRPLVAELSSAPIPPVRARQDLDELLDVLVATSLLSTGPGDSGLFVHRWTAAELERLDREQDPDGAGLTERHRLAAEYWRWRVTVWPQDKDADLHDQLEARYHLLAAGDLDEAVTTTEHICARLDQIGAWDHETELVHDTLHRLPADSPRRAASYHNLGILAQARGDYPQAERRYQQSLNINEHVGNQAGMATSYGQLGLFRAKQGKPEEAVSLQLRSLAIHARLQSPNVSRNIAALRELRAALGGDDFTRTAATTLDKPSMTYLLNILDEPEQGPADE
ncbi:MAG: tetratricopeptide repeat protein, partial [Sciscionella sp.]